MVQGCRKDAADGADGLGLEVCHEARLQGLDVTGGYARYVQLPHGRQEMVVYVAAVLFDCLLTAVWDDGLLHPPVKPVLEQDLARGDPQALVQLGEELPQTPLGCRLVAVQGFELAAPLTLAVPAEVDGELPGARAPVSK